MSSSICSSVKHIKRPNSYILDTRAGKFLKWRGWGGAVAQTRKKFYVANKDAEEICTKDSAHFFFFLSELPRSSLSWTFVVLCHSSTEESLKR